LEKVAPPKGSVNGEMPVGNADDESTFGDKVAKKIAAKAVGHLIHDDEHHIGEDDDGVPGTEDGNDTMNRLNPEDREEVEDAIEEAVEETVEETVPDTPSARARLTDEQLATEELVDLSEDGPDTTAPERSGERIGITEDEPPSGLIETPYVPPSDEWEKTSQWFEELQQEDTPIADAIVNELHPEAFDSTTEWADAVRLARSRYESWRASQIAQDPEADASLEAYLDWLEERGLKAAVVAGSDYETVLAHATDYWTDEKRAEAAKRGIALPDGQYPIADREDLRKAISAYGRAKDPAAVKRHIMRRASALGELELIPDDWAGAPGFDPAKHLRGPDGKFISQGKNFKPRRSSAFAASVDKASVSVEELRGRVHGTG
jgi:hypothetical protein